MRKHSDGVEGADFHMLAMEMARAELLSSFDNEPRSFCAASFCAVIG
jgi:hypothetical protein